MVELELRHRPEDHPAGDFVAAVHLGGPVPWLVSVQRRRFHSPGKESAGYLLDGVQGPLNAVKHRVQESGAQFHGERQPRRRHRLAHQEPRGVFVHLDEGRVALQADDFTDQLFFAHLDNIVHAGAEHPFGDHRGAGDFPDGAAGHGPSVIGVWRSLPFY